MSPINTNCLAEILSMIVLSRVICNETFLTVSRNLVAVIGDRVELDCRADPNQSVFWGFTSFNTSRDTDIYINEHLSSPFASRYRIDERIGGKRNLIIDCVDRDHAGKYRCTKNSIGGIPAVANLTVLDSNPNCSVITSDANERKTGSGQLLMKCAIAFFGSMIPIFNWTKFNTKEAIALNASTSDSTRFVTTSSLLTQLHYDDNGVVFKCRITFELPNNYQGSASDFDFTWNYTAHVLCLDSDTERTLGCTTVNIFVRPNETNDATTTASSSNRSNIVAATVGGGSLLLCLVILIIAKCFVNSRKRKVLQMKEASCLARSIDYGPNVFEVDLYSHGSNAFRLLEHPETGSESTASYAVVNIGNDSLNGYAPVSPGDDHSESAQIPTQKKKRKNRVGADGTQYLDLSDVRLTFDGSPLRAATPPAIYRMNYALIDHTSRAPPPPPKF